jgi:autotransporter-associated beta strand protein
MPQLFAMIVAPPKFDEYGLVFRAFLFKLPPDFQLALMKELPVNQHGAPRNAMRFLACFLLLCLFSSSSQPMLRAATRTWSGAGTNNFWSNTSNWVEQLPPIDGDDLLFPASASRKQMQNDLSEVQLAGITISGVGYRVTGNSLALKNGIDVNHGSPTAGSFTFDADLRLAADQTFATTGESATLSFHNVALNGHHLICNTTREQGSPTIYVWGDISGTGELTKTGVGSLMVNTPLTFSGVTRIEEGSLTVRAAFGGALLHSPVLVQTNGFLNGNGLVHSIECRGGTVHAGPVYQFESGPLTVANSVSFDSESKLIVNASGPTAGAQYNQLQVSNSVDLGSCRLEFSATFSPTLGQKFVIIDNLGNSPVAGTFAGLPENGTFLLNAGMFHVNYRGGDGNDVVIRRGYPPATGASVQPLGSGLVRLQALGLAGVNYGIEASVDLNMWSEIGAAVANDVGVIQFIDAESNQFPERFYRLRSP